MGFSPESYTFMTMCRLEKVYSKQDDIPVTLDLNQII